MKSEIKGAMEIIEIADAHHHLMLDQPVALIEELKRILRHWNY